MTIREVFPNEASFDRSLKEQGGELTRLVWGRRRSGFQDERDPAHSQWESVELVGWQV